MTWGDFHRRREIMDAAVEHASRAADRHVPFDQIAGAKEFFGDPERLLLALHQRWNQTLSGFLRSEVAGPEDADDVPSGGERDHVDAVGRAWNTAVTRHPALHAVLEANVERYAALRRAHEAELRMLAVTAGMAQPHESAEEAARVGATLVALIRNRKETRRVCTPATTVAGWLRKLAPTG